MRAVLISNPNAGRLNGPAGVKRALEVLSTAGWQVRLEETDGPGRAIELARQARDEGVDAVLVAGGDGTLNEAVQALTGSDTALGYLPTGTVNVWAREVGIPLRPDLAARALATGRRERIDLGKANDRFFLLMASLGFDSEVLRRAQPLERHKQRFGILPYVATGLSTAPMYRGVDVELRYEGVIRRVQALMLVVGNTRLYGGRFRFTPRAVANDGWLDVCIVRGRGPLAIVRQSVPVLISGSIQGSDVELLRVKEISVRSDDPLPLQVDGELVGCTPTVFSIVPDALNVIVPRDFASDLIA